MVPARRKIIAGNWKMNGTLDEAGNLARAVARGVGERHDAAVILFPPFTALAAMREAIVGSALNLGAQNLHWETKGAFTGEIAAPMLRELGCSHVIIGHSERRHVMGETDEMVAKKVKTAIAHGLTPVLCVGELLREREEGKAHATVERQCSTALAGISMEAAAGIIVAYEPVWAIGTGKNATPEEAEEMHGFIRGLLAKKYDTAVAARMSILYGGSVNAGNASGLLSKPNVDGALVGGASLKADDFLKIIASAH